MDSDFVQGLRYKLQKRFRRLNGAGWQMFPSHLRSLWDFMQQTDVLRGVLTDLERRSETYEPDAERIFASREALLPVDEAEAIGLGYWVVKKCIEVQRESRQQPEVDIGFAYGSGTKLDDAVEKFREYFVEPLYEYVDEQLDDQRAVLSLMVKYKQKCEWFRRDDLFALWSSGTQHGERTLARHLYEFLHDQGVQFHIEPSSASGEADLVEVQRSDERLILDAKIFDPASGRGKDYLARGVNQVYIYTSDYNQPVGYLVVYKVCPDDLRLALTNESSFVPFLVHNNKTIFILVVDIFRHEKTASKRGAIKPIEITETDLIKIIGETADDHGS